MQILNSKKIVKFLLVFVIIITVTSLTADLVYYHLISSETIYLDDPSFLGKTAHRIRALLSVDHESSIPTWYSSIALFICAVILCVISSMKQQHEDRFSRHWLILSGIFLALSADEIISIHEMPTRMMINDFHLQGFLYYGWVIPIGILFLIFVGYYIQFLMHLSPRIRFLFIFSGAIFVGGALGAELVSGFFVYIHGGLDNKSSWITIPYILTVTIEELMEMTSVVVFMYALLLTLEKTLNDKNLIIKITHD